MECESLAFVIGQQPGRDNGRKFPDADKYEGTTIALTQLGYNTSHAPRQSRAWPL